MKGITNLQILNHAEGRFGNQLFRIATLIGFAKKNNIEYHIPKEWEHLKYFKSENNENILPSKEIQSKITSTYHESGFHYNELPSNVDYLQIKGYFQSEKYFDTAYNEILSFFDFKDEFIDKVKTNFSEDLVRVCLHVRHGDFYDRRTGGGHKGNENYHPVMTLKYYENAVEYLLKNVHFDEILVFTDHPETKEFIYGKLEKYGKKIIYYDYSDSFIYDFIAQTLCNHFIIPNSTFSWWSSYLSKSKDKIICSPYENDWLGPSYNHFNKNDLLPNTWIKITQN